MAKADGTGVLFFGAEEILERWEHHPLRVMPMEEMQDQRSKDALKAAITEAYETELELQIRSPKEAAEEAANGGGGADSTATGNGGTSATQESAMVRAAMAMGATVVVEEAADDDSDSTGEN